MDFGDWDDLPPIHQAVHRKNFNQVKRLVKEDPSILELRTERNVEWVNEDFHDENAGCTKGPRPWLLHAHIAQSRVWWNSYLSSEQTYMP
jgi:hypothetical protein